MDAMTLDKVGSMSRSDQFIYVWRQVFGLLKAACPALSVAVAIVTVLEALAGIAVLYLVKLLIDAVSGALEDGAGSVDALVPILTTVAIVISITVLLQNGGNVLRLRQGLAVGEYVDNAIHERALAVDLRYYESPHYYDAMERARQGGAERPAQIVSNSILSLKAIIVVIGVVSLIAAIDPLLIPLLLLPVALAVVVRLFFTQKLFQWRMQRAQMDRRSSYLDWLITSANHAKELRLNRIGAYFQREYRDLRARVRKGHLSIEQQRLIAELVVALVGAGVFVTASIWLLEGAFAQQRPIGDAALFVLLLRRLEGAGSDLVGNVSRAVDDHLYLKRLFEFLAGETVVKPSGFSLAVPTAALSVRFDGVSFRYDGNEQPALDNVSLELRSGKIVALVGENGSGKTTIIKLLTRLYEPTHGSVLLNGVDAKRFEIERFRALFSVIFQDYACYAATVGDNIRFGDVNLVTERDAVRMAAMRAGAASFIEQLPKSYDTLLTKLFDEGRDLSVGQWQRLALARAFYPQSKFVILDEPTSAIDPKAEFELFDDFRARLAERGALLISHRLSTIRLADYTYVMERGRIVEEGTHEELMARAGAYATLFEKQAQYYR